MSTITSILFSEVQQQAVRGRLREHREAYDIALEAEKAAKAATHEARKAWKEAADEADRFGITYGALDRP